MHNHKDTTMIQLNRTLIDKPLLPVKVVQFGDGNFLRGFADYVIDLLNEKGFNGGVAVVKNRPGGSVSDLQNQEGLFTLFTEGIKNGNQVRTNRLVSSISSILNPYEDYSAYLALAEEAELKIILSNTTEAGIVFNDKDADYNNHPHYSFPAKLTALLYRRFMYFNGDAEKGCIILPCELIENNADVLKNIVLQYAALWQLGEGFVTWINNYNRFYNTLVDRIVSGYPKDNAEQYTSVLPYKDALITVCEPYLFWAIEGDEQLLKHFPVNSIDENILLVPQLAPYRLRKVRILNGLHTLLAQVARLLGKTTVRESMEDGFCESFLLSTLEEEILPTIPLPCEECKVYATEVLDRFRNPYLNHRLTDIALNSVSKFRARLLPVMDDYYRINGTLPAHLVYTFACLCYIYKVLPGFDEEHVLNQFSIAVQMQDTEEAVAYILNNLALHTDNIPDDLFIHNVANALQCLEEHGVTEGFTEFSNFKVVV